MIEGSGYISLTNGSGSGSRMPKKHVDGSGSGSATLVLTFLCANLSLIRRAVDMSSGGPGEDRELESEAEMARKQVTRNLVPVICVPTLQYDKRSDV
jgi:hypothetical protein